MKQPDHTFENEREVTFLLVIRILHMYIPVK